MSDSTSIQVNFSRPMPLFPLDAVSLLPQQFLPLHIFEPRYRQMVDHVLDGSGQIAMAVFDGDEWKQEYHARPAIRPAVCVGQIRQHERMSDGRYNLLLQGICRARVAEEVDPEEDGLYRVAMLDPIGVGEYESDLEDLRDRLEDMLSDGPLTQFAAAEEIIKYLQSDEVPVNAIVEFISCTMVTDTEQRYFLLSEGDARERASLVLREMKSLQGLIGRAMRQVDPECPKGCSWN